MKMKQKKGHYLCLSMFVFVANLQTNAQIKTPVNSQIKVVPSALAIKKFSPIDKMQLTTDQMNLVS